MRNTVVDADVREVPAGEVWVGALAKPRPHVAIATRDKGDDLVVVCRFTAEEAQRLGGELIRLALSISAPQN